MHKTAICGTDVHIYNWDEWSQHTVPVPMVTGHEFMGVIEQVGSEVVKYKPGNRVTGEGHITCGYCRNCRAGRRHLCRNTQGIGVNRPGCFAEKMVLPASNVFRLPDDIGDELGSIFDPLGNATHTALSFDLVGEDVLVTGAGPIGIMACAIARHVGARHIVVTDLNEYRLKIARSMGATLAVHPQQTPLQEAMRTLGMTEGFDVGMEMSGSPRAFASMLEVMNHGGCVALLGIFPHEVAISWDQVIFKGLVLKGIYGREMFETWYKMTSMLQSGLDITPVITHRMGIDQYEEAFATMRDGQAAKVILQW
jgi:threonine 3-dehydrogenase